MQLLFELQTYFYFALLVHGPHFLQLLLDLCLLFTGFLLLVFEFLKLLIKHLEDICDLLKIDFLVFDLFEIALLIGVFLHLVHLVFQLAHTLAQILVVAQFNVQLGQLALYLLFFLLEAFHFHIKLNALLDFAEVWFLALGASGEETVCFVFVANEGHTIEAVLSRPLCHLLGYLLVMSDENIAKVEGYGWFKFWVEFKEV